VIVYGRETTVNTAGGSAADKKRWTITFLCSPTDSGPIGGSNFGTGVVTLVQ